MDDICGFLEIGCGWGGEWGVLFLFVEGSLAWMLGFCYGLMEALEMLRFLTVEG